jgi:hypothetical protein
MDKTASCSIWVEIGPQQRIPPTTGPKQTPAAYQGSCGFLFHEFSDFREKLKFKIVKPITYGV